MSGFWGRRLASRVGGRQFGAARPDHCRLLARGRSKSDRRIFGGRAERARRLRTRKQNIAASAFPSQKAPQRRGARAVCSREASGASSEVRPLARFGRGRGVPALGQVGLWCGEMAEDDGWRRFGRLGRARPVSGGWADEDKENSKRQRVDNGQDAPP